MEKTFQTGSFSFRLKFPEELVLPVDMEKFLVETDSADYTYIITAVDILPEAEGAGRSAGVSYKRRIGEPPDRCERRSASLCILP